MVYANLVNCAPTLAAAFMWNYYQNGGPPQREHKGVPELDFSDLGFNDGSYSLNNSINQLQEFHKVLCKTLESMYQRIEARKRYNKK
jgi:hypothetical protein